VIPSIMLGSAVAGALSMLFGCQLRVPHGGVFVLPIPNAVANLPLYILAIVIGTAVTAGALFVLKRPIGEASARPVEEGVSVPAVA
jgi:fructose PTS system EIIBC or EIIC component